MKTMIKIVTSFLFVAFLILTAGCNNAAVDGLNIPTPGAGTGGGVLPGTADGVAGDNYFYVGVDKAVNSVAHVHSAAGFNEPCSIINTTSSAQDIVCIIDIPESASYYNGLALKVSQPADMCQAIGYLPYWYYNEEIGVGPTEIKATRYAHVNASGDFTWSSTIDCEVGNDGNPTVADPGCSSQNEIDVNIDTNNGGIAVDCHYDNSDEDDKNNCCLGQYTYSQATIESNDVTGTVTTTLSLPEVTQWGGDPQKCLGGPGRGWTQLDSDSFPVLQIVQNPDPTAPNKKDYRIASPNSLIPLTANKPWEVGRYAANYFTPAVHTHSGYVSASTSTNPYYVTPIDDRSGSPIVSGNPAYTFACLDHAYEFKHRISVYVREWDSYIDYLLYISSAGATVVPDRRGISESPGSTICEGVGGECNDFHDADDFVLDADELNGSYDTTVEANRFQNFPYDIYNN